MSKKNSPAGSSLPLSAPPEPTSSLLASWEDGIKDAIIQKLAERRTDDGSHTPVAFAVEKAPRILLRVGALTSKTLSGSGPVDTKGRVIEPFELVPAVGDQELMHVTLNFRNDPADMAKMALAAIVTAVAFNVTKRETPADKKPKRWNSKTHNAMLDELNMERNPVKDALTEKTLHHTWAFSGVAEDLLQAVEKGRTFPAEALAFFKKAGKPAATAIITINVDGAVYKVLHNSGESEDAALVKVLRQAGLKIDRIEYASKVDGEPQDKAVRVAALLPDLVYIKGAKHPVDYVADVDVAA